MMRFHFNGKGMNGREAGFFICNFLVGHGFGCVGSPPLILPASRSVSPFILTQLIVAGLRARAKDCWLWSAPVPCAIRL